MTLLDLISASANRLYNDGMRRSNASGKGAVIIIGGGRDWWKGNASELVGQVNVTGAARHPGIT